MGTSDVVLVSTDNYRPHPEYHAFFHPAQIAPSTQAEMSEGLAKEKARLRYFNMLVYKSMLYQLYLRLTDGQTVHLPENMSEICTLANRGTGSTRRQSRRDLVVQKSSRPRWRSGGCYLTSLYVPLHVAS
jgi:hypothetical protein